MKGVNTTIKVEVIQGNQHIDLWKLTIVSCKGLGK